MDDSNNNNNGDNKLRAEKPNPAAPQNRTVKKRPPAQTPPQNLKRKNPPRPRKKKINPTTQSLLGIFIFALGLALTIAVLYLAYNKFYAPTNGAQNSGGQIEDTANTEDSRDDVKDINKASFDSMVGQWAVRYGLLTAYVTITDDQKFQITLFMDRDGYERRVQSGTLVYDDDEGVLELVPSYERLPKPAEGILKTLTRNKYSVVTLFDRKDGQLIWVPHNTNTNRDSTHPLFKHLDRDKNFIRWQRTK